MTEETKISHPGSDEGRLTGDGDAVDYSRWNPVADDGGDDENPSFIHPGLLDPDWDLVEDPDDPDCYVWQWIGKGPAPETCPYD